MAPLSSSMLLLPATLALLLVLLASSPLAVDASCCDVCLAQTDPAHPTITYDPLVYNQCSPVKGICCFGCDFSHGSVTYQEGVSFDATSGAAVAKAGTRIKFAFNGISRVTYDLLRENQKKTSFVGNASMLADKESGDGVFSICVTSAGTISLRGWGTNSCTQVTAESTITVEAGGTTCAVVGTVKPASGTSSSSGSSSSSATASKPNEAVDTLGSSTTDASATSGKYDTKNCNLSRGSVIKNSDGTSVCECAGDWRNPPACDEYSWTKTILTIGGAVATLLSIVISVRAYVKSRKAKAAANNGDEDNVDIDDRVSEEVLRIDRRSPSKLPPAITPGGSTRTSTASTVGSAVGAAATRSPAWSPNEMPRVKTVRETTL